MQFLPRAEKLDMKSVQALVDGGFGEIAASLLVMRGILTPEDARDFLCPESSMLHDPFLLNDMDKAVERIEKAIENGEKVVIYGDYDADGVTAVAVLKSYFDSIGAQTGYYIPSRHLEGYGLNNAAIESLAADYSLMITVDCGIDCFGEIERAKSLGLETIVTDHHQIKDILPDAIAVVNPLLGDYPCRRLCGAGVALKLVQALGGVDAAMERIDIAAIGTVADIVPLLGENRVIAALGLEKMNNSLRLGIDALFRTAGLRGKNINSGHIGYMIGPRINAGGRIDRSAKSVDLLLTEDAALADEIAAQLEEHNSHRQRLEREIAADCEKMIDEIDFLGQRAIVLVSDNWNLGVIGIVASRLVEKWAMPVILFSREGGSITGSGRSVQGIHIFKAISSCAHLLTRFGGHEMAAGLTMPAENFETFKQELNAYLARFIPEECYIPKAQYDLEICVKDVSMTLHRQIEKLLPFGVGNPSPTFLLREIRAEGMQFMGADKQHIKFNARGNGCGAECVGFSMADKADLLRRGADMLVQLGINEWNDKQYLQILLRNCRPAESAFMDSVKTRADETMRDFLRGLLYTGSADSPQGAEPREIWQPPDFGRGDMLICSDIRAVSEDLLEKAKTMGVFGRFIHEPDADRRAFPCLVAAPIPGESFSAYRRFVFTDEPIPRLVSEILRFRPDAELLLLKPGEGARMTLPGKDEMRTIYSYVAVNASRLNLALTAQEAAEKAAADLGISRLDFYCALMIFGELGFAYVSFDKWRLEAPPKPQKRDLSESILWRQFGKADG